MPLVHGGGVSSLRGVTLVDQGFARSEPPFDSWSEAVRIEFEPSIIPLRVLLDVHLRTHASTSDHKMRGKYRSAVYAVSEVQANELRHVLDSLQSEFDDPLVTQVLSLSQFELSKPRFQRYFERHEGGPFCTRYIEPKLAKLRTEFGHFAA